MKIAVTMRTSCAEGYHEVRDAISHDWIPYLIGMGYIPILIPNSIPDVVDYVKNFGIQALLLTGGNDISPEMYSAGHALPENDKACAKRDETETKLLKFAIQNDVPVVGICRGMQLINVYFGGGLVKNIAEQIGRKINHIVENHPVRVVHKGFASLLKKSIFMVNSFHNQGLTLSHLANELKPFAISEEDGIIEGLFHNNLKLIGIQWHPERKNPSHDIDKIIIKRMFEKTLMKSI